MQQDPRRSRTCALHRHGSQSRRSCGRRAAWQGRRGASASVRAIGGHAQIAQRFKGTQQDIERRAAGGRPAHVLFVERLCRDGDEAVHQLVMMLRRRRCEQFADFHERGGVALEPACLRVIVGKHEIFVEQGYGDVCNRAADELMFIEYNS